MATFSYKKKLSIEKTSFINYNQIFSTKNEQYNHNKLIKIFEVNSLTKKRDFTSKINTFNTISKE